MVSGLLPAGGTLVQDPCTVMSCPFAQPMIGQRTPTGFDVIFRGDGEELIGVNVWVASLKVPFTAPPMSNVQATAVTVAATLFSRADEVAPDSAPVIEIVHLPDGSTAIDPIHGLPQPDTLDEGMDRAAAPKGRLLPGLVTLPAESNWVHVMDWFACTTVNATPEPTRLKLGPPLGVYVVGGGPMMSGLLPGGGVFVQEPPTVMS